MGDAVSVEAQWEADRGRCLVLPQSLTSIHFQAVGEIAEGTESLLSRTKVTDCPPPQEVLGFDLDTEIMTISLPARNLNELKEMLEDWPAGRRTAPIQDVLVYAWRM